MPLREACIVAALAAMVATVWRVFSPVARLTAGVTSHDTAAFDEATRRLISSLGHGSAGRDLSRSRLTLRNAGDYGTSAEIGRK